MGKSIEEGEYSGGRGKNESPTNDRTNKGIVSVRRQLSGNQ